MWTDDRSGMRVSGFLLPRQPAIAGEGRCVVRDNELEGKVEKANARVGEFLAALTAGRGAEGLALGRVTGFRVRLPTVTEPSVLLIIRAESAEGRHIAFVGAFTVRDAVLAWRARSTEASIKWRVDVPWDER